MYSKYAPLGLKQRQTVKKSSHIALAIVELHESEGRPAGRQLVSQ